MGGQCGICKTNTPTMLNHYFAYFGGLRSIEEHPVEHDFLNTDVSLGSVASVIHLSNLESTKGTEVYLLVHKASNSWLHSNTTAVASDSLSSLDMKSIVMSLCLHLNLEDKVLLRVGILL